MFSLDVHALFTAFTAFTAFTVRQAIPRIHKATHLFIWINPMLDAVELSL